MKNKIIIFGLSAWLLSGCSVPFLGKRQSALQINSTPKASVYLNGNHVGQTSYINENLKPGEYTVRIAVDNDPNLDWQTKINLNPGLVTVIQHNFGNNNEESSNFVLSLEPLVNKTKTQISIITIPDNVIVKVDGKPEGFSPVVIDDMLSGDHTITLAAPGYQEMNVKAQAKEGYKLMVNAQLAKSLGLENPIDPATQIENTTPTDIIDSNTKASPSPSPKNTPKPSPTPKTNMTPVSTKSAGLKATMEPPYVTINETGTGWLRVRSEANGLDNTNEVAKVNVGEKYKFIEASSNNEWFRIEYSVGNEGWISSKYATLTKDSSNN